jgi:hypothetical protein
MFPVAAVLWLPSCPSQGFLKNIFFEFLISDDGIVLSASNYIGAHKFHSMPHTLVFLNTALVLPNKSEDGIVFSASRSPRVPSFIGIRKVRPRTGTCRPVSAVLSQ